MAWTFVGNAAHLSEGSFPLPDVWSPSEDPAQWAGLWATSTTTVLEDADLGGLPWSWTPGSPAPGGLGAPPPRPWNGAKPPPCELGRPVQHRLGRSASAAGVGDVDAAVRIHGSQPIGRPFTSNIPAGGEPPRQRPALGVPMAAAWAGVASRSAWIFDIGGGTVTGSLVRATADNHWQTSTLSYVTDPSATEAQRTDAVNEYWDYLVGSHAPRPADVEVPASAAPLTVVDQICGIKQAVTVLADWVTPGQGLDMGAGPSSGPLPAYRTSVPKVYAQVTGWSYESISALGPSGATLQTLQGDFWVGFKDPTVIRVPRATGYDKWLMFLTRIRVPSSADLTTPTAVLSSGSRSEALSDIVVFVSNNIGFVHDPTTTTADQVLGPYLVVDSLSSVAAVQAFRTSSQVPCAVFDGNKADPALYVYYVSEAPIRTSDDTNLFDSAVANADLIDRLNTWAGGDYLRDGRGFCVKKIAFSDLEREVLLSAPTPQEGWTRESAVTGELLGLARIWIAVEDGYAMGSGLSVGTRVELWDHHFYAEDLGTNHTPVKVDPFAVYNHEGGGIRIFFACFERNAIDIDSTYVTPANGWGIWQAAPIEDGVFLKQLGRPLAGAFAEMRYGRDFIVRKQRPTGEWPDMLAPSDSSAADRKKYMDPDVFVLPGSQWVMLAGCVRYYLDGTRFKDYVGNPLARFEGDEADLTWGWADAW